MVKMVLADLVTKMAVDPSLNAFLRAEPDVVRVLELNAVERRFVVALNRRTAPGTGLRSAPTGRVLEARDRVASLGREVIRSAGRLSRTGASGSDGSSTPPRAATLDRVGAAGLSGRPLRVAPPGSVQASATFGAVGGLRAGGAALKGAGRILAESGSAVGGETGRAITGASENVNRLGGALDRLASSIGSLDLIGGIHAVGELLGAGIKPVGDLLLFLGNSLGIPALVTAGNAVNDFADSVTNFFDTLANESSKLIDTAVGVVTEAVTSAASAVGDAIGAAAGAIGDAIGYIIDAVTDFFAGLFGSAPAGGQPATGATPASPAPTPSDPGGGQPPGDEPPGDEPTDDDNPPAPEPGGDAGFDGGGDEGTGGAGGQRGFRPGGSLGSSDVGSLLAATLGRQPSLAGIGSGVIDPVDTALGRVAVHTRVALRAVAASAARELSEGDGGGTGPSEPGTGSTAGGLSGARVVGADLRRLVPRLDLDPNPAALAQAFGQASRRLGGN